MSGYVKNIAVVKGLKDGFSSDGGELTGLVKVEKYASQVKAQITLLNFAPVTEGKTVAAISDGVNTVMVENGFFEGDSPLDISSGFAALICYVNGGVYPVASAICGNFYGVALKLKEEVEKAENLSAAAAKKSGSAERKKEKAEPTEEYHDEAIAEINYYELAEVDADGGTVRKGEKEKKSGGEPCKNEAAFGAVEERTERGERGGTGGAKTGVDPVICADKRVFEEKTDKSFTEGGAFYERMRGEIDNLFSEYPRMDNLESVVENSRWVKIDYGDGCYYVFGIIYGGETPKYLCYGVPAKQNKTPPESMRGMASFIPADGDSSERGFWVMYQDAQTGASLKIEVE